MTKISIIVPVYNTEKYLRRCMDALVNQTYPNIEILAIDDGSTDDSPNILKEYLHAYPDKVRVITKKNGGQASARNIGIRKATGDYVGFADSDDYVDTAMFEKMFRLAREKDADMVECSFHYIEEKESTQKELKPRGRVREYSSQKDMLIDPQVSPWNKLYRKSILLENRVFFPEGLIYEDTSFYIKSIPYLKRTAYLEEPLVYYFLRQGSTMNANKSRKVGDIFFVLEDILKFYRENGFDIEYHDELEYFCVKILFCSSLSRIGRIKDPELEKKFLNKTFSFVKEHFPTYKLNPYFSGKIGFYIRMLNYPESKVMDRILGKVMKG